MKTRNGVFAFAMSVFGCDEANDPRGVEDAPASDRVFHVEGFAVDGENVLVAFDPDGSVRSTLSIYADGVLSTTTLELYGSAPAVLVTEVDQEAETVVETLTIDGATVTHIGTIDEPGAQPSELVAHAERFRAESDAWLVALEQPINAWHFNGPDAYRWEPMDPEDAAEHSADEIEFRFGCQTQCNVVTELVCTGVGALTGIWPGLACGLVAIPYCNEVCAPDSGPTCFMDGYCQVCCQATYGCGPPSCPGADGI